MNEYLFDKVRNKANDERIVFEVINENEVIKIKTKDIFERMMYYDKILKEYKDQICVIYHNFDADFAGFVISAWKNHVKIMIRRTSLEDFNEINDDISFLKRIIPVSIVFVSDNVSMSMRNEYSMTKKNIFLTQTSHIKNNCAS